MIAIREANPNIEDISKQHVLFIAPHVKKIVRFYIAVFQLLPMVQRRGVSEKTVKKKFFEARDAEGLGQYKSLLKPLLKGKMGIKNEGELKKFKFKKNLRPEAKAYAGILSALSGLLNDVEGILALDFGTDRPGKIKQYSDWKTGYSCVHFLLPAIFDYEQWFSGLEPTDSWGPYQLAKALHIQTCPYCNRHYTFSLSDHAGRKMGRPDFDHFIPKSTDPLLALSFYNLVPACKECNGPSVKADRPVNYLTHLSPFEQNAANSLMRFSYLPKTYGASVGDDQQIQIYLKYAGDPSDKDLEEKIKGNISLFHLEEIYQFHADIVQEIIKIRHISDDKQIEVLQQTYQNFDLSFEDAYRLVFGNYFKTKDFHKRPLSKLTRDIAIELQDLVAFTPAEGESGSPG